MEDLHGPSFCSGSVSAWRKDGSFRAWGSLFNRARTTVFDILTCCGLSLRRPMQLFCPNPTLQPIVLSLAVTSRWLAFCHLWLLGLLTVVVNTMQEEAHVGSGHNIFLEPYACLKSKANTESLRSLQPRVAELGQTFEGVQLVCQRLIGHLPLPLLLKGASKALSLGRLARGTTHYMSHNQNPVQQWLTQKHASRI